MPDDFIQLYIQSIRCTIRSRSVFPDLVKNRHGEARHTNYEYERQTGDYALKKIMKAETEHISEVARLFDLYRQFYDCDSDSALATQFIKERIENDESDIFVTIENNHACGFVQLYPSFCSIQAAKIFILEDLYVEAQYRKTGLGESLMKRATQWAREKGAARLDLLTAKSNNAGQSLYEKLGYRKVNQDFYAYSLDVL